MNILFLDDRIFLRGSEAFLLAQELVARGHAVMRVLSVADERRELRRLRTAGQADVAIIDLQLAPPNVAHVMGGTFARELRADVGNDKCVVVIFTINETPLGVEEKNRTGPAWGIWHLRQDVDAVRAAGFVEEKARAWGGHLAPRPIPDDAFTTEG